jgi:hypothetical protein
MSLDQVHNVGASTDSVLAITRVDLPSDGSINAGGQSNPGVVSRLELLDDLAAAEILGQSAGVGI